MSSSTATSKPTWQEIVTTKLVHKASLIPAEWRLPANLLKPFSEGGPVDVRDVVALTGTTIMTEQEATITEMAVEKLLSMMANGILKAYDVCLAFCKRAAIAHQFINVLTEIRFKEALQEAKALDEHLKKTGQPVGPLHGLPISLQDTFDITGCESSKGFVANLGHPAEKDHGLVDLLRRLGAIPGFVKTNMPTGGVGMYPDSTVHGRTLNPCNRNMAVGGAVTDPALVAMRGSPLGIGYDSGRGVRIGTSPNGVFCLYATSERMPFNRKMGFMPETAAIVSSSLEALDICARALVSRGLRDAIDPGMSSLPWKSVATPTTSPFSFAVIEDMGLVTLQPPILRAIKETIQALRTCSHDVVEWKADVEHSNRGYSTAIGLWTSGGNKATFDLCARSGEPMPKRTRFPTSGRPGDEIKVYQANAKAWQEELLAKWMETAKLTKDGKAVDAVISPVMQSVGNKLEDDVTGILFYTGHCTTWTLGDYSVCVIPVTNVKSTDTKDPHFKPKDTITDHNDDPHSPPTAFDQAVYDSYDLDKITNTPVGLQIICRRWEEEKVLEVAKEMMRCLELTRRV